MKTLSASAWDDAKTRDGIVRKALREDVVIPRKLGKDPLAHLAAADPEDLKDIPTLDGVVEAANGHPLPTLDDGGDVESALFGDIFFDWKKGRSLSHLHGLMNAVAFAVLDDLLCMRARALEGSAPVPDANDEDAESYAYMGRQVGALGGKSGNFGELLTGLPVKAGAFVDPEGGARLDWPLVAAEALRVRMLEPGGFLQRMLPRFRRMQGRSAGVLNRGFSGAVKFLFAHLIYPRGKAHIELKARFLQGALSDAILDKYVELIRSLPGSPNKKIDPSNGKLPYIMSLAGDMSLSLFSPVPSKGELNTYSADRGYETLTLSEAGDDPKLVERFLEQFVGNKLEISMHAKMLVPKRMAEHMCQSEDVDVHKLYKAAERMSSLAFPKNGIMTDKGFDEKRPELAVLDADELDASASSVETRNGYELAPIKESALADEDGVSVDLRGNVQWVPPEKPGEYKKHNEEFVANNEVVLGGRRMLSPFMARFLDGSSVDVSFRGRTDGDWKDRVDEETAWANEGVADGSPSFVMRRDRKTLAHRVLKTSRTFGKVLYANEDGDIKAHDVDGNRPASKRAYLNMLNLANACSPTGMTRKDAVKELGYNRRVHLGILTDLKWSLENAGMSQDPTSYMEESDFAALLAPDESMGDLLGKTLFPDRNRQGDDAWTRYAFALNTTAAEMGFVLAALNDDNFNRLDRYSTLAWTNDLDNRDWMRGNVQERLDAVKDVQFDSEERFEAQTSMAYLMRSPVFNFVSRAIKEMSEKIGGDYSKLLGPNGRSYARMREAVPLYIAVAKYGRLSTPGGIADLEKEVEDETKDYDPDYGKDVINKDTPTLPLQSRDNIFLPHHMMAEHHLKRKPKLAVLDVDAGGGKTFMAIMDALRMMKEENATKILVVCPGNLLAQYTEEAAKFTEGKLNVFCLNTTETYNQYLDGDPRELLDVIMKSPPNTLFVVSSSILQLAQNTGKLATISYEGSLVERNVVVEALRQIPWDVVYVDESHRAKSQTASYYRNYARLLERAKYIRLMSGTFIFNVVDKDLLGQARLLDPGMFGTDDEFAYKFMDGSGMFNRDGQRKAMNELASNADVVQIRRANWAQTLPAIRWTYHPVELSDMQDQMYRLLVELMDAGGDLQKIITQFFSDDEEKLVEDHASAERGNLSQDQQEMLDAAPGISGGFLFRTEKFLTAPDKDPFVDYDKSGLDKKIRDARRSGDDDKVKKLELEKELIAKMQKLFKKFSSEDKISPKTRYLLSRREDDGKLTGLLHWHFHPADAPAHIDMGSDGTSREKIGKVMIFVSYRDSAKAIYEYLSSFPEYRKNVMHYTAEKKFDLVDEMKLNPDIRVVVGVENSLNTGFNFQMFSRLVRIETVWAPGTLEQGESRINRPDIPAYLADEVRALSHLDVIACDRTIDITKSMKLIAKHVSNAKANNMNTYYTKEDGEEYYGRWVETMDSRTGRLERRFLAETEDVGNIYPFDDLKDPPPIKMSADIIRDGHTFESGLGRKYGELQQHMAVVLSKEHVRQKELIAQKYPEKTYKAANAAAPKGSAIAEMPEISLGKLAHSEDLGLVTLSGLGRLKGMIGSELVLEDLGDDERLVHTQYGDGTLTRLGQGVASVDFGGFKETGIPKNSIHFIVEPRKLRGKTVREALASKVGMKYIHTAQKDHNTQDGLSSTAREKLAKLRAINMSNDLDLLRRIAENMGLVEDASGMKSNSVMRLFQENIRVVEEYQGSLDMEDDAEELDDETQRLLDEAVDGCMDRSDITKRLLLDYVVEEMGLVDPQGRKIKRNMKWYKELARKRKKGILTTLADEFPNELVDWWHGPVVDDGETEEIAAEVKELLDNLNKLPKESIALVVREFSLADSFAEAMSMRKNALMKLLRDQDPNVTHAWWKEDGGDIRPEVADEEAKWQEEQEGGEEELKPPVKKTRLPVRILQINNIVSAAVDRAKVEAADAKKMGMSEVGPYWFFDCSTYRRMDAFIETLMKKEEKGDYYVAQASYNELEHFAELLETRKGNTDALRVMRKAQRADIRMFFRTKVTKAKKRDGKDVLELMPVVMRDEKGAYKLFVMAWEEKQEQVVKKLMPGKFRTGYLNGQWAREDGFWFKMFVGKAPAREWLKELHEGSLHEGYETTKSAHDRALAKLKDIRILQKVPDARKLRGRSMDKPWTRH